MEVSLYTAALDPEFTGKFDDKLDENFAKVGSDNILKDAYFDDLKKAFGINGGDEFDEKKVKKYIEEVSRGNPELFVSKNGKVSTPDQIIAGFRGSWDFYRQGTKTLDRAGKLENLDSNNGAKGAYDRGVLHGVSGLFMAGITIATGIGNNGKPTAKDLVNIIAGSVMTATLLTEDDLLDSIGPLLDDATPENLAAQDKSALYDKSADLAKKFEEGAKGLGGGAGVVMGAYGTSSMKYSRSERATR